MTDAPDAPALAPKLPNRWLIAIMGTVLRVTLGTIYAWSFFQKDLMAYGGWNNPQVAMIIRPAHCGQTSALDFVHPLDQHRPRLAACGSESGNCYRGTAQHLATIDHVHDLGLPSEWM